MKPKKIKRSYKELFYVKEMTDKEFKEIDLSKMRRLSTEEADMLLSGKLGKSKKSPKPKKESTI